MSRSVVLVGRQGAELDALLLLLPVPSSAVMVLQSKVRTSRGGMVRGEKEHSSPETNSPDICSTPSRGTAWSVPGDPAVPAQVSCGSSERQQALVALGSSIFCTRCKCTCGVDAGFSQCCREIEPMFVVRAVRHLRSSHTS